MTEERQDQKSSFEGITETVFSSKRNWVRLVRPQGAGHGPQRVVIKQFDDPVSAAREAEVLVTLQGKLAVPQLLEAGTHFLALEFIEGMTLADWLEGEEKRHPAAVSPEAENLLGELVLWLKDFYRIMKDSASEVMIMGDVNLRNFLVGPRITGIDFEEVGPGRVAQDLGAIAAFIRMYDPEDTPWKQKLAEWWLQMAAEIFSVAKDELNKEMETEIRTMRIRRSQK